MHLLALSHIRVILFHKCQHDAFNTRTLTRHMQLSSSDDKFSGLGLVGPADVHAGMVAPCVPNHQVRCEDNYISGNRLSICTKRSKTKNTGQKKIRQRQTALRKVCVISQAFSCQRNSAEERSGTLSRCGCDLKSYQRTDRSLCGFSVGVH